MTHNTYPPAIINGLVYHKAKGDPYAYGCNKLTITNASASRADFEGIDLDLNVSADRTAWGSHNAHPTRGDAWYDPQKKIGDDDSISRLPDSEIKRLQVRYKDKICMIKTARQLAGYCRDAKPRKLIPCFETKSSGKFLDEAWWEEFKKSMPVNSTPIIMSLPTGARDFGIRKLACAHSVGLPTMLLWRSDCLPLMKGWQSHVDLVKSFPGRGIYAVK